MTTVAITARGDRLPAYALFGGVLSAAGLPIYIFGPKFYADTFGVSLTALAAVLFGLRLFDVVQDPFLGWISERLRRGRGPAVAVACGVLGISMIALFAVAPPIAPLVWFAVTATGLFTAFSFLTINFYAQGVAKADTIAGGHVRLAAWRESGALFGVCVAAVTPTLIGQSMAEPFAIFAFGFAAMTAIAALAMAPEWTSRLSAEPTPMADILSDPVARRLLILALVNAAPLAISSTLFLFFVESVLAAPGWEGPLLVLFFLSAALSAPAWARLATLVGERRALLSAMVLAIVAFGGAVFLGPGDVAAFGVICVLSGAAIGADLTLLPAMFARRMARVSPNAGQGFGLWSLVSKFSLAFAAIALLPTLEAAGFASGTQNSPAAVSLLTYLYALLPCALKLIAIALLIAAPQSED